MRVRRGYFYYFFVKIHKINFLTKTFIIIIYVEGMVDSKRKCNSRPILVELYGKT